MAIDAPADRAWASPIAETARLALRRLTPDDASFILELVNEPAWLAHIGDRGVRTQDDARSYIAQGPLAMYDRLGFGLWLTALKHDGTPVGICGLIKRETLPDVDLGFALLSRFHGRGYAREAAGAAMAHARDVVGLRRVVAIASPANAASRRLLQDLGFLFAQTMRLTPEDHEVMLYTHDFSARGRAPGPASPQGRP
jgi:RimJ/RimL family protein N-acetyltransferase